MEPEEEPNVTSRRCGLCRGRARRGAPCGPAGSRPSKLLVILLALCFADRVAELCGLRPTGALRLALLPLHALVRAEYAAVIATPAVCAVAVHTWHRLELPGREGVEGQRIARNIEGLFWTSLAVVSVLALCGDPALRPSKYGLTVYAASMAVFWLARAENTQGVRRLARTWFVFMPLIFEYKVLYRWTKHAALAKDQESRAYAELHSKYAPRVFRLLVEQGGVFVKIGQLLSLLPAGVIPEPFMREFKKLQSTVPPRPGSEVRKLVAQALGRPVESVFSRFDEVPIGSASIGQVHRARLRADGREVVVKVQYPEVSRTVEPDFRNCERIAWLLDKSRVEEVREAKKYYISELDFRLEASTLARVHRNLRQPFPEVKVPEPILEFCAQTVLVMTFVSGTSLLDGIMHMAEAIAKARGKSVEDLIAEFTKSADELAQDDKPQGGQASEAKGPSGRKRWRSKIAGAVPTLPDATKLKLLQHCMSASCSAMNLGVALYNHSIGRLGAAPLQYRQSLPSFDPQKLSYNIWRVHGHQLLVDGLFSTDPHPGNILLSGGRGGSTKLGLIDFGQVCEVGLRTRVRFARLLVALAADDDHGIAKWHAKLGVRSKEMGVEMLALSARVKFGEASVLSPQTLERYRALSAKDPILTSGDDGVGRAERLINILRGTSFILGVPAAHCPASVWLDMARGLLEEHGDEEPDDGGSSDEDFVLPGPAPCGRGGPRRALAVLDGGARRPGSAPARGSEDWSDREFFDAESGRED